MANPFPWATNGQDPWQRAQQEQQRNVQFVEQLLSGGMPEGYIPTMQNRMDVLGLFGKMGPQMGWDNVAPAMQQWVGPAMSGAWGRDAQAQAAQLLAQYATSPGGGAVDPRLTQYLGAVPSSLGGYADRGDLLASMAPQYAGEDWFNQLYSNFMQQAAPGGTGQGLPMARWASAANPYLAMAQTYANLGQDFSQSGLPGFTPPQPHAGMTRQGQNVAQTIWEAMGQLQGQTFGPQGWVSETPADISRSMVTGAPEAMPYIDPSMYGAGPNPFSPEIPGPTTAPATQTGPSFLERVKDALGGAGRAIGSVFTAPMPGLPPEQRKQAIDSTAQAVIQTARDKGTPLQTVLFDISNNYMSWLPLFGGDITAMAELIQVIQDEMRGKGR